MPALLISTSIGPTRSLARAANALAEASSWSQASRLVLQWPDGRDKQRLEHPGAAAMRNGVVPHPRNLGVLFLPPACLA